MKKGFTLIELLAVILILGIIALIAVPQVTNVISNANKGAAEVSAKHYIDAINNTLSLNILSGKKNINSYSSFLNINEIDVEISGEKPESGVVMLDDKLNIWGGLFLVNGYNVMCDETGKCISDKEKYMYLAEPNVELIIGEDAASVEALSNERPTNSLAYLKVPIINDVIGLPSSCIYIDGNELCLPLGQEEPAQKLILDYFGYDENTWTMPYTAQGDWIRWKSPDNKTTCQINEWVFCYNDRYALAESYGSFSVGDVNLDLACVVSDTEFTGCGSLTPYYD